MPATEQLTYLGLLAAPTTKGSRAVAIAFTGAVEMYYVIDAGLDTSSEAVRDWLWNAGINPDEAAQALPSDFFIKEIAVPALDGRPVVIHHSDLEVSLVDSLVNALIEAGNTPMVVGLDLNGPIAAMVNGAAPRRAIALQARYEAALAIAEKSPLLHTINGKVDPLGHLTEISVSGPFIQRNWVLEDQEDAFFVLTQISHVGPSAAFIIEGGPAQIALKRLANDFGLAEKLAA